MPELPEAEACARRIEGRCIGQRIEEVEVRRGPYLREGVPLGIRERPILLVGRRGKKVIFEFLGHPSPVLVCSLGMSGYWDVQDEPWTFDYVEGRRSSSDADVRVVLRLDDGALVRYHDSRMFGRMEFSEWNFDSASLVPGLGPEPLETHLGFPARMMTEGEFVLGMLGVRTPIKARIMDQAFVAGIGNIYANEACHLAGIDPAKPAGEVPPASSQRLWFAIQSVLSRNLGAIQYGWLKVYRRHACGSCEGPVLRTEIQKRATFRCPKCQPTVPPKP